jgi:hypothetical protein
MDLVEIKWSVIVLAQDRDEWRAFVKTIMNLWFTQNFRKFFGS